MDGSITKPPEKAFYTTSLVAGRYKGENGRFTGLSTLARFLYFAGILGLGINDQVPSTAQHMVHA